MGNRHGRGASAKEAEGAVRQRSSTGGAGGGADVAEAAAAAAASASWRRSFAYRELRGIEGIITDLDRQQLRSLDLSHNKLGDAALRELTECAGLETLILDHNRLEEVPLPPLPALRCLTIGGNRIRDLESALCIIRARCPQLQTLSLLDNPCVPDFDTQVRFPQRYQNYRHYVVGHVRSLRTLDLAEVTEHERAAADAVVDRLAQGCTTLEKELGLGCSRRRLSASQSMHRAGDRDSASPPDARRRRKRRGSCDHPSDGPASPMMGSPPPRRSKGRRRRGSRGAPPQSPGAADASPEAVPPPAAVIGCEPRPSLYSSPPLSPPAPGTPKSPEEEAAAAAAAAAAAGAGPGALRAEGLPLPQLRHLLCPRQDWLDAPPPPPPPPADEFSPSGTLRPAGPAPPAEDAWSGSSSDSSSGEELQRVLERSERAAAVRAGRCLPEPPLPPPPEPLPAALPRHWGPHTPTAPPPNAPTFGAPPAAVLRKAAAPSAISATCSPPRTRTNASCSAYADDREGVPWSTDEDN